MRRRTLWPLITGSLVALATAANADTWQVEKNISLHHFSEGQGEPILVVHGGPGYPTEAAWDAAQLLGDQFRMEFYDQRGCGRSTRPIDRLRSGSLHERMHEAESQLGLGVQIEDIERIRRILGHDKIILMGHSFGGLIATLYASRYPEHVKALILVAPANLVVTPRPGEDLFGTVRKHLPPEMLSEYDSYMMEYFDFETLLQKDEPSLASFYARFAGFYSAATGTSARASPTLGGWMPLAVYLSLGPSPDYRADLQSVTAPTLVIHGTSDLIPVSDSETFASYLPHARLVTIDGAGHSPFNENPEAFAETVADFLAGGH